MNHFSTIHFASVQALVAAAMQIAFAASAAAQTDDHLKCFKIKDATTFDSAAVDLDASTAGFGLEGCTIKGRAKEFCVPAGKTVTSITGGSVITLDGEELAYSRLCYRLKCPASEIAPVVVTDQFGSRTIAGFKAVELCTPAVFGGPPEESLDDTFDGTSLDPSWTVLHPGLVTISVSGGALHLTPTVSGGGNVWYQAGEGPLVYKEVTGDFDVTATLTVRDPSMTSNPPPPEYRFAGILARDPAAGPVNTVHTAMGAGSNVQGTCYEYKSTDDSVSTWAATPSGTASGQVRLRRSGATIEMYWRATSGDSWTMIHSFNRPDLAATLQVGPMVYAVDSPPSIEALFDDIVFQ
ncbi:MAG TPA: hypothetical protein VN634_11875 [Candidatus Limnocylindrales bacterium]|nr:hypothetical protein [Candidatus Limnocylindrales bacterium]